MDQFYLRKFCSKGDNNYQNRRKLLPPPNKRSVAQNDWSITHHQILINETASISINTSRLYFFTKCISRFKIETKRFKQEKV